MATTPAKHLKHLVTNRLWLRPEEALQRFRGLFGLPNLKAARTFLAGTDDQVSPAQCVHNLHLNQPEVIQAYRNCVTGRPWGCGVPTKLAEGQAIPPQSEEDRQRHEAEQQRKVAEMRALVDSAREGAPTTLQRVRQHFDDVVRALAPTTLPLNTPARRDAYLLATLAERFAYPPRLSRELGTLLRDWRKGEALAAKAAADERRLRTAAARDAARVVAEARRQQQAFERSLVPSWQVPGQLAITKTEYERWREAGFLPVYAYREFRKWGRTLSFAVHDPAVLAGVTPEQIAQWRQEHHALLQETRHLAAGRAQETRKENDGLREAAKEVWSETEEEWAQQVPEALPFLALAYWTVYASRWAKVYHERVLAAPASRYTDRWRGKKTDWYAVKDQALRLLVRSPYATLSFLAPFGHQPDIEERVRLCDDHYADWGEERDLYFDFADFVANRYKILRTCPRCQWNRRNHCYDQALYALELVVPALPEVRFSFHTPYQQGRHYLPAPRSLPPCPHVENVDGAFRFGRPLVETEHVTHTEARVQQSLTHWLQAAQNALHKPTPI